LYTDCMFNSDVFPVCSPALVRGNSPFASKEEILEYPLIHATELIDDWERWFEAAGLEYPKQAVTTRYNDQLALQQAAIEGQGITLARGLLVESELRSGRLIRPIDISIRSRASYFFVCPEGTQDNDVIKTFHAWIKREAHHSLSFSQFCFS
ncbi:MAG: hypothetical protein KJO82_07840, partial [Gammaproteobacteria bacterium]|nr:hypothetical protein [Gammaproteobacteria bacterium]